MFDILAFVSDEQLLLLTDDRLLLFSESEKTTSVTSTVSASTACDVTPVPANAVLQPGGEPLLDPDGDFIAEPTIVPVAISRVEVTTAMRLLVQVGAEVSSTVDVTTASFALYVLSLARVSSGVDVTTDVASQLPPVEIAVTSNVDVGTVVASQPTAVLAGMVGVGGTVLITATAHLVSHVEVLSEISLVHAATVASLVEETFEVVVAAPAAVTSILDATTTVAGDAITPPGILGGLRARLVRDSLAMMLEDELGGLGWFDAGRRHLPVRFIAEPLEQSESLQPNLITVSTHSVDHAPVEVGSDLGASRSTAVVEIYAQDESFGEHLWGDVRDVLRGRVGARLRPVFPILDLRLATPVSLGYAQVVDVTAGREWAQAEPLWQRNWFRVEATVEDVYLGDPPEE